MTDTQQLIKSLIERIEPAEKQALLETYASAIGLDHVYFE